MQRVPSKRQMWRLVALASRRSSRSRVKLPYPGLPGEKSRRQTFAVCRESFARNSVASLKSTGMRNAAHGCLFGMAFDSTNQELLHSGRPFQFTDGIE